MLLKQWSSWKFHGSCYAAMYEGSRISTCSSVHQVAALRTQYYCHRLKTSLGANFKIQIAANAKQSIVQFLAVLS